MVLQHLRKDACQPQNVQGCCWLSSLIPAKMKNLMYLCQVSGCKRHSLGMCEQHLAQQHLKKPSVSWSECLTDGWVVQILQDCPWLCWKLPVSTAWLTGHKDGSIHTGNYWVVAVLRAEQGARSWCCIHAQRDL